MAEGDVGEGRGGGADGGFVGGGAATSEDDFPERFGAHGDEALSVELDDAVFLLVCPVARLVEERFGGHQGPVRVYDGGIRVAVFHSLGEIEGVEVFGKVEAEAHAPMLVGIVGPHQQLVADFTHAENSKSILSGRHGIFKHLPCTKRIADH